MNKRIVLVGILLTTLVIAMAAGSVQAQMKDPSEYEELSYDMITLSWDPPSADAGPPVSEQLAKIGINAPDMPLDDSIFYPWLDASPEGPDQPRTYDLYEMSHGFRPFPQHLYYRMHTANDIDYGYNHYNLNEPEMDALIDKQLESKSMEELRAATNEIQVKWAEYLPYIPIYVNDDVRAMTDKWQDVIWDQPASTFGPYIAYKNIVSMWADDGDQEFVMAYPSDVRGTNPTFDTDGRSIYFSMLVYAPLLAWDRNLDPVPWLATDWSSEVVGGKTVITYTIRDNVFWHDNTPVTAEDVAFTFNYGHEADESSWYYTKLTALESAVADGNTVTVTMDSIQAWSLLDLGLIYILPKHIWEGVDNMDERWQDHEDIEAHVGCGPFKFVERVPEESFKLTRWGKFWEPAKFETFQMRIIRTSSARVLALQTGEVDAERYNLDVAYAKTMQLTPGIKVTSYADMWDYVLGFNLETPGLDDYEVRKAIAYVIDRQQIINRAMLGWGTAIYSPVPEAFYPSWYNPDTPKFTTGDQEEDIAMANQILDDAGYIDVDGDGIREFPGAVHTTTGPSTITQTLITSVTVTEFSLSAFGVAASGMVPVLLAIRRKRK